MLPFEPADQLASRRPARKVVGAIGADDHQARQWLLGDVLEHVRAVGVDPMEVLDDEHDGAGRDRGSDERQYVSSGITALWAELADHIESATERAGLGGRDHRRDTAGEPGDELAQQPSLANPCLARHEHQLGAVARGNLDGFDQAGQSSECRGATDHRRRQAVTPGQHRVDDTSEAIRRRSGHAAGSQQDRCRLTGRPRGRSPTGRRRVAPWCA